MRVDEQFEEWYSVNAFDFVANPIGSRDCGLQREAYLAGASNMREKCAIEAYEWAMAYVTEDTAPIGIADLIRSLK